MILKVAELLVKAEEYDGKLLHSAEKLGERGAGYWCRAEFR
ncbi:MAG: hypothetical protein ACI4XS_11150 [Bacillus sp. (in: firmicutes)]